MTTPTPPHLGGAHHDKPDANTWMPDVWGGLIDRHRIRSMIDIGCGAGWVTQWWAHAGVRALGVEGDPAAFAARRTDAMYRHDYTAGPFTPKDHYDLGWCAEFVEHVEEKYMANWMATMQACRLVVITFATPGQGGHHHVNEQPEEYWIDRFATAAFDIDREETARMRGTSRGEAWGRPTLTMFRNRLFGHPDPSWVLGAFKR